MGISLFKKQGKQRWKQIFTYNRETKNISIKELIIGK
jgi:hypothetical protein